jgi:hypothetical protein
MHGAFCLVLLTKEFFMRFAEPFYVWKLTIRVPTVKALHLTDRLSLFGLLPEECGQASHEGEMHSLLTLDLPTTASTIRVDAIFRSQVELSAGEVINATKILRAGPVRDK